MAIEMASEQTNQSLQGELDKRQAIIEAACELFTTAGYADTTIAQVAKSAGVAVGTVYIYFKNKSDLLMAVKGNWEAEVLRAIMRPELDSLPYHARIRPIIEASFDICARHAEMVQLMGVQPEMVGEWQSHGSAPVVAALTELISAAIAEGTLRQVDPEMAAVLAYGMVNGALLQCFVAEDGKRPQTYIAAIVDALENWLVPLPLLLKESPSNL